MNTYIFTLTFNKGRDDLKGVVVMINQFDKIKDEFFRESEDHFYSEKRVEKSLDEDEITCEEAAFMRGYISS